ncbi:HNH endonuclease signature motif containing protein [Comamonas sp.]|uniref:HNH endonuclease n=1 Tax=Comamonas sp. TaxID=34028 RepID=UPI0028A03BEA|nr:HNH endonuclease signature motif containing protein [Comamonas sp.]
MTRETIPKKLKDALLDEYDHRCAICGGDRPHVHHIDEDASHNTLENLLPLCPNCHLRDQHNPTRKVDIPKLQLFRKYKDPAILKPQFHPIYLRQCFLNSITQGEELVTELENSAKELIEFIEALEMGEFYGKRLTELIGPLRRAFVMSLGPGPDHHYERQRRSAHSDYREKLLENRAHVQSLLVELLRYQNWAHA